MDEEETQEQGTPEDTGEGVQSETVSELDRADQIAERQKRENDRREELLSREENLAARRVVGGETEAGSIAEKPKALTDEEYTEKFNNGEANPFK